MCPHAGTADDITTGRIPVDIRHTVVFSGLHQLKVGGKVLLGFGLLSLKVHVPEVHVKAGLGVNGSNDNEATLRRPVDRVAVLLLDGADKLEVTDCSALLLRGKERHGGLGCDSSTSDSLAGCDENEPIAIGLPSEIDHSILKTVNNLNRNTLLAYPENLEVGGRRLLRFRVSIHLHADIQTLGLPVKLDVGNIEQITCSYNFL